MLIIGASPEETSQFKVMAIKLLESLGFIINKEKLVLHDSHLGDPIPGFHYQFEHNDDFATPGKGKQTANIVSSNPENRETCIKEHNSTVGVTRILPSGNISGRLLFTFVFFKLCLFATCTLQIAITRREFNFHANRKWKSNGGFRIL
jgi:hypothetical protein